MKIKNFLVFALAAMTMVACQKNGPKVDPNEENLTGEKTYAVLNIAISQGNQVRAETPGGGGEPAIHNEADITNASIYIFKWASDNSGVAEVKKDVTATQNLDGSWHVPATAVMLTSGKKHVIVVANLNAANKALLDNAFTVESTTSYADFYKKVIALGAAGTPDNYTISNLFLADDAEPRISMSGESDPTLNAGVSATEAEQEGNKNHIRVYIDRLPAKIDVALNAYATNMDVVDGTTTLGNVTGFTYDARNMNREENIMKSITGTFVNTPYSAKKPWTFNFPVSAAADWDKFFPIVSNDLAISQKILTASTGILNQTNYREYVTYMPENTNEDPLKGNTSYVALKASYVPATGFYATGFENDATANNVVKLTTATFTPAAGQFSMFNFDYNIAFKMEATAADAAKADYIKAIAAYHLASKTSSSELKDITAAEITVVEAAGVAGYTVADGVQKGANVTAMKADAVAKATAAAANGLYVYYGTTTNAQGDNEQIQIVAYYVGQDNTAYVVNQGVDFGMLTCGIYNTDANGLTCYYRVNIFDEAFKGSTNMMYYSVVRNYSYHMTVTKINSIGYPTQIDLVVDPDEPLNTNTFIQAHIMINDWTAKKMETELDR